MFLREQGRKRTFLDSYIIQTSPRERFPQREFFQLSLFHFNRQASHTATSKLLVTKKNLRFSALFICITVEATASACV